MRALFGGSFDPIHAGHVAIVDLLLERKLADVVHVVPARRSPFKRERSLAPAQVRFRLVALALKDRAGVVVEDLEIARRGPSYTIRTLDELVARHTGDRWRLVFGADQAASFASWQQPGRLLELAEPIVIARGSVAMAGLLADRALIIGDFDHPASASAIRRELAAGRIPGPAMLPAVVAASIRADGLYGVRASSKESPRKERT